MASSAAACSWSRSTFRRSFIRQNRVLDFGNVASLQPGCWCQKQPCTNITFLRDLNTRSGRPGRDAACKRWRYPESWRMWRTNSSGLVFVPRIRLICALRWAELILSVILSVRLAYLFAIALEVMGELFPWGPAKKIEPIPGIHSRHGR